jgi:hypothetical protein
MIHDETRLYASHHQFYIEDSEGRGDTGDPSFWSKKASKDHIAIGDGILGIGTGSYGFVKVRVEVHTSRLEVNLPAWDHVTEAGLELRSPMMLVYGCLSMHGLFFRVQPGYYVVRCCHADLAKSVEVGKGGDWYLVQAWPGKKAAPRVLKRWHSRA